MKILNCALAISATFSSHSLACSDIFINKAGYHIEARTLDFLVNLAFEDKIGFVGDNNTTDVVIDAEKIPTTQLTSWKNKYGYFGRAVFNGAKIIDAMNTEGFSIAILYLPGTQFPAYDPKDQKPVVAIYDLGAYLLSQAKTVSEALKLVRSHQLVQSAVKAQEGIFIKDLPIHYVLRDKTGGSAVIEFVNGQVKIYDKAGDIMTNSPPFDWQLKNANYYDSLIADSKNPNEKFSKTFYDYDEIYKTSTVIGEANLMGTPGDFTPASRFARARVLLNNLPAPTSHQVALYQASSALDSLAVPALNGAAPTLWSSIKDLDESVYYVKNITVYQGNKSLYPFPITSGYTAVDLKSISFNGPGSTYAKLVIQPTPLKDVKKIAAANDVPELRREE